MFSTINVSFWTENQNQLIEYDTGGFKFLFFVLSESYIHV